jgi:O-antigen/teichoic acid export membrane protein
VVDAAAAPYGNRVLEGTLPTTAASGAAAVAEVEPAPMRSLVVRGLAWKAVSRIVLQLSRFVVAVLLARLLTPAQFGLAAMVLVLSGLVVVVGDAGLGAALVQRRTISDDDKSTVFWTSLGIGAVFTLAGVAAAGPVANFYDEQAVKPLLIVLSTCFFLGALGTTPSALLVRDMNFRALELRQMGGTIVGAVVGIGLAIAGYGAWALIGQQVATTAFSTVCLWWFCRWAPSLRFSRESLRDIGGFTGNVFGQNLLYYAGRNADNLLVGRYIGSAALGAYSLAYNVMLAPFHQIGGLVQQVLFPAFARLQDDRERLADVWIRATRLVAAITTPALVGLVVVAPEFVSVVLGHRWHAAVPVVQILAWVGLIQSLQTMNGDVLLALGKASTIFRYTVVWFAAGLASFVIGLRWGIVGVAGAYAVACTFVEPVNAWLTSRALGISIWRILRGLAPVAQASAAMGLVALCAMLLLREGHVPPAARLGIVIAVGAVAYVPLFLWRCRIVVGDLRRVLERRSG